MVDQKPTPISSESHACANTTIIVATTMAIAATIIVVAITIGLDKIFPRVTSQYCLAPL